MKNIYIQMCRETDPLTILEPKQLSNVPHPHPRYDIDHCAGDWDPFYSSVDRIRSFRETLRYL